jgi:hypothetical protein
MDFIPGIDGPSESVPRVLACFSNVSFQQLWWWTFLVGYMGCFTFKLPLSVLCFSLLSWLHTYFFTELDERRATEAGRWGPVTAHICLY